ncbi:MAG: O-antigen ligase family protein, partial [Candidatus Acidiferrales bacterium]
MPESKPIKRIAAFVGFVLLGFVVVYSPQAAILTAGLILAAVAFTRPAVLKLAIVGVVLVPTIGFLRSSEAVTNALQLAQSIESGSMVNRLAGTTLLAVGVALLFWGRHRIGRINLIPWVGGFIAFAFLSFVWSQGPAQTLRRAAEALFVAVFALGVGAVYYDRKPEASTELIRTMCWASSLLSFAVLVLSVARGDFHIANPAWRLGRIGIENQIAWCASVGFLGAWTTRTRKDIWTSKTFLWFNLAIPGLTVLLTKSRETWLGVLAAVFFLEILKPRAFKKKLYGAMAVISAVVLFTQVPALKQMWNRGETEEDMETASGRTQIWQQAIPMIQSHLFLGHGYGAFWIGTTVLTFSSDWSPTSLHNGYLDSTAEAGLVGLFLIGIGVWVSSMNAWKLMKYPGQAEVALVLLSLTVNFMVINLFGAVLEVFNYFPVTALLVYSFFVSHRLETLARIAEQNRLKIEARTTGLADPSEELAWAASSRLQREPFP